MGLTEEETKISIKLQPMEPQELDRQTLSINLYGKLIVGAGMDSQDSLVLVLVSCNLGLLVETIEHYLKTCKHAREVWKS